MRFAFIAQHRGVWQKLPHAFRRTCVASKISENLPNFGVTGSSQ
jgi:hypothetical protein